MGILDKVRQPSNLCGTIQVAPAHRNGEADQSSAPLGAIIMLLFLISMPPRFPYQNNPQYVAPTFWQRVRSIRRLDVSGAILLLAASILLVTAILEGGVAFDWNSAASIVLFVLSGILFIAFAMNEGIVEKHKQEPLFPWRFAKNRVWIGILLCVLSCIEEEDVTLLSFARRI